MISNIYVDMEALKIGLSFLAGFFGALIGGAINIWIHFNGIKNMRAENKKERKNIISLAVLDHVLVKNVSPSDIHDVVNDVNFSKTVNSIDDLNELKKNISNTSIKKGETLDDDTIKLDEQEAILHE